MSCVHYVWVCEYYDSVVLILIGKFGVKCIARRYVLRMQFAHFNCGSRLRWMGKLFESKRNQANHAQLIHNCDFTPNFSLPMQSMKPQRSGSSRLTKALQHIGPACKVSLLAFAMYCAVSFPAPDELHSVHHEQHSTFTVHTHATRRYIAHAQMKSTFHIRSWKYVNSIRKRDSKLPLTTFVYFNIICPFSCSRFVLPLPPPLPLLLPLLGFVSIGFLSLNLWWDFFRNNWRKMFANFCGTKCMSINENQPDETIQN